MQIIHQKASERGTADYGWLKATYYFSFAQYYDPQKVHFGLLRVLNDDYVAGGGGFPTHPHDNMEIVTIPLSGALQHRDSTGGSGIIHTGDVQIMSAGRGVHHSEMNASLTEPVTLFQIWIFPKERNIEPRYDQRTFDREERINKWQIVVSPREEDKALWINQDAIFALARLEAGHQIEYVPAFPGNGIYLVVISGSIEAEGNRLEKRDSLGVSAAASLNTHAISDSEILVIEVPMR